jgi:molybdate transport system substrate-binding protein
MRSSGAVIATALAACVLWAGCGSDKAPDRTTKKLKVFSGAGLQPPVAEAARIFEAARGVEVAADYAGSEVLLSRITLSQTGDVYIPGDKHYVDLAAEKGFVLSQRPVCYFVPTILVRKGNPKGIAGLADLVKPDIRLGLGNAQTCAIGRICRKIFDKNGIAWEDVRRNLKFESATVNELGLQIDARSLDAVIVWDAVAKMYRDKGQEVPIPVEQNVISTVEVGVLKFTSDEELAAAFAEFLASDRGREIFRKHDYRVDPPR